MIDTKAFKEMNDEFHEHDKQREELIKKSRDIINFSKRVIYSVHRDDSKEADKLVLEMKKEVEKLNEFVKKNKHMYHQGSYKVAIQEYVEALLYYHYMKDNKLATKKELDVETDYYLLGLCDLTGELVRKAVHAASNEKYDFIFDVRKLIDEIYSELLKFDIHESELRKKFDGIKYDLKKLEDLCLELKLKGKV
jgi:translin